MSKSRAVTRGGKAMSLRHLREQRAVDLAHAKDHAKAAKDIAKRLKKAAKGKAVGT